MKSDKFSFHIFSKVKELIFHIKQFALCAAKIKNWFIVVAAQPLYIVCVHFSQILINIQIILLFVWGKFYKWKLQTPLTQLKLIMHSIVDDTNLCKAQTSVTQCGQQRITGKEKSDNENKAHV